MGRPSTSVAVEKAKEARRNGLAGVLLPPLWGSFPAYHYPLYDPFWAVCQDLDMPVHFHSGPAPMHEFFGPMPPPEGQDVAPAREGEAGSRRLDLARRQLAV